MAHIGEAQKGLAAVKAQDWKEAVYYYTAALNGSLNPLWLLNRSKSLHNLGRHREALDDANLGWHMAYERSNRELMTEAHHRRAVSYFRLGELANADACCIYAMRMIKGRPAVEKEDPAQAMVDDEGFWKPKAQDAVTEALTDKINGKTMPWTSDSTDPEQNKSWRLYSTLRMQILRAMEKLPADDPNRKLTITAKPEKKALSDPTAAERKEFTPLPTSAAPSKPAAPPSAPKIPIPSDTPLRVQDFQSNTTMSVSIFSKGVKKESVRVELTHFSVRLDPLVYPSGEEKEFKLDLWGEIDPSQSTLSVTPNKVELNLRKKVPGKWTQLHRTGQPAQQSATETKEQQVPQALDQAQNTSTTIIADESKPTTAPKAAAPKKTTPSYPTSSRSGPKDWDRIGGDEDDDDTQQGDPNAFFKKLFKDATPDQQRAMMKSFTESNGTSLSTDWADVKDRTVETVPPQGVEAKKWG